MYLLSMFPLAHESSVRVTSVCLDEPEGALYPPTVVSKEALSEALASLGLFEEKRLLESPSHAGTPLQFSTSDEVAGDLFFCMQFGTDGLYSTPIAGDSRYVTQ